MTLPQNNRDHKNKNLKKREKKNGEAITILTTMTMTVQKRPNATKNGHTNYIKRFLLSFFCSFWEKIKKNLFEK
jgi:hypothetical protein